MEHLLKARDAPSNPPVARGNRREGVPPVKVLLTPADEGAETAFQTVACIGENVGSEEPR